MHEYSLMEGIITSALQHLGGVRPAFEAGSAAIVRVRISAMDFHSPAAMQQAFDVLKRGTALENARLEMEVSPVALLCRECGYAGSTGDCYNDEHESAPFANCPACGALVTLEGKRGVDSITIEFDD